MSSSPAPIREGRGRHSVLSKAGEQFRRLRDTISPHGHRKPDSKLLAASSNQSHGVNDSQSAAAPVGQSHEVSHEDPSLETNNVESSGTNDVQSLWALAFKDLQKSKPELTRNFKYCLNTESGLSEDKDPGSVTEDTVKHALSKINEVKHSKEILNGKSETIRTSFEQAIKLINSAKQFISGAVAVNPYAAAAWTGICLLLPVSRLAEKSRRVYSGFLQLLTNPIQENDASITGVAYITKLMNRYIWMEKIYLNEDSASDFSKLIKDLYVELLDYQATLLVHLHRNSPSRWARSVFKAGDWENRITKIKQLDFDCKQLADVISDLRAQKWQNDERQRQKDLIEQNRNKEEKAKIQMLYSNYEAGKNANPIRVAGTCEWFLGHPDFLAWRQSQTSSLLWLSADPGCGKSVLSKYLVDCKGEALSLRPALSIVCYFFFKDGDVDRVSGAKAICALLHQIFLQRPRLYKHAEYDLDCKGDKLLNDFDALWNVFMNATNETDDGTENEIICVLDALDECRESSRRAIITKLIDYYGSVQSHEHRKPALKFLVTSRPYASIEWDFKELTDVVPHIRLYGEEESESIRHEIDRVIEFKVKQIGKRRSLDQASQLALQESLSQFPHRTYLWLHLVLDIIQNTLVIKKSKAPKAITEIPESVNQAYTAILDRSDDPEDARKLLHIILAAVRPLSLEEVNVAMNINEHCDSKDELELYPAEQYQLIVKNMCGLFISVVDSKVYLIHQTAREFLLRKDNDTSIPPQIPSLGHWKGTFNAAESNLILAKICIFYLLLNDFENHDWFPSKFSMQEYWNGCSPLQKYLASCNLLDYAAEHWHTNFRQAGILPELTLINTVTFKICDIQSQRYCNWARLNWSLIGNAHSDFYYGYIPPTSALLVASILRLEAVVRLLLKTDVDVEAKDINGWTPIFHAGSDENLVRLLIENGSNVNVGDGELTLLHHAVIGGFEAVTQLLLEKGADTEAKTTTGMTALDLARSKGQERIVQILLYWIIKTDH